MDRKKIKEYFIEAIRLNQKLDSDFKSAIINHERTNYFIDQMVMQVYNSQRASFKRGKLISVKTIKDVVYSMTDFFIDTIKMEEKKRSESILSRLAREAEIQKQKDMEATLAGKPSGDFEGLVEVKDGK